MTRSIVTVTQTPTITAGAYSANDAVGGLLTFENCTNAQGTGIIKSIVIVDEGAQSAELDLVLFDRTFTATADNAAFNISDADAINAIGAVNIPAASYTDMVSSDLATVRDVDLAFKAKDDRTIYGQLVTRGTPTYVATNDLTVKIVVEQSV